MKSLRDIHVNPWREISILMMVLMEVCWVTPWFRSLTAATYAVSATRVFTILAGMVLFAHLLVRVLDYLHLKKTIRQGLMMVFIIISIFAGIKTMLYADEPMSFSVLLTRPVNSFADLKSLIPAEFIVIVVILVAYWRGLSIAQAHIGPSSVMDHFWLGIGMYVAFIFINTLVTGETPGDFFYLFLFASLVAMCAARMTVSGMLRGGNENKFNRFWLMGIILSAALVVALSAFLGGVAGDQFTGIGTLFLGLFGGVLVLLWLLISPIISFLITFLGRLFNSDAIKSLGDSFQSLNLTIQGFGQRILDLLGGSGVSRFIERWGPPLKTFILIAIIVFLILGVIAWMAIKLWQDRIRRQVGAEQKTDLKAENLWQKLMDLLRQGWMGAVKSLTQLTDFNHRQKLRAAARIRQVYGDLMELCETLGQPRDEAATPLEFLPQLNQMFPELQPETTMITEAYNRVRYGQLPEIRQEVDEIEAAWTRVSTAGRELLTQQKHDKKKEAHGISHP